MDPDRAEFHRFPDAGASAPSFDSFLSPAPELLRTARSRLPRRGPERQQPIPSHGTPSTLVARDQAYWVRAGDTYNQYFGPFQVTVQSPEGIRFGNTLGQAQLPDPKPC